ncbi:SIP domain-containing protein [Deinococcus sp. A31D244]|uniref:SIP domain-containing protein n=1 Tax=Deinococcus sp. A31D244 TaxID=3397675 RepID=UPI0039E025D7
MTTTYPDLSAEEAAAIIDHVNEDHPAELLLLARAFTPAPTPDAAAVTALYEGGLDLQVTHAAGQDTYRVAFTTTDVPPKGRLRATVAAAREQLNEQPRTREVRWTVQAVTSPGADLRRLTLHADPAPLTGWRPGYAARFRTPGGERTYTLRRVHPQAALVEVDVYLHGDTPGSVWASSLHPGDPVEAILGRHETLPDLHGGAALLLGDETALPTLAALLEHWPDAPGPRVLIEIADPGGARYLDDVRLPPGTHLSWVPRAGPPGQALERAAAALDTPVRAAWGALGSHAAREIRTLLRAAHGLDPASCRVVGYWQS